MDKANAVKFAFLRTLAKKIPDEIMRIKNKFLASLDDDFNTPGAMACVFELVNAANRNISRVDFVIGAKVVLKEMLSILNITLEQAESVGQIGEEQIKSRIADRLEAKRARDYALADKIRKDLELQGVILEDTREGTTWRRKI
jgi:cysteinyl-tRNA synthetase